jgi:thiol:disulfide interchange protein DsbA
MLKRAILLVSLLLVTATCFAAAEAKTTAPSLATATAASLAAGASTASAASKAPAAAPVPNAAPTPQEGVDYTAIEKPDPVSGPKVQVVEVFNYGCIHCAHFQPFLGKWLKTLPADVQFSYLPGSFGGLADGFQRAYYAAQLMGVQEKSHDNIFKAVHVDNRVATAEDIPKLYADYGVDPKVFASTMQGFAVSAKVSAANDQAEHWAIEGTPTMVVDGRYRVGMTAAGGPEAMLRVVDWLIVKQRPEHTGH